MPDRKLTYFTLLFFLLLALILGAMISSPGKQELKIVFLNVGQGDAILISQGSNQLLVDSGKSGQVVLEKLRMHVPFWDRKIETVIMTHPDQDHIGGFADVFKNYKVEKVLKTNAKNDSKTFESLEEYILSEGSEVIEAKKGTVVRFSNGAKLEIIYPFSSVSSDQEDTNGSSVVAMLENGSEKFLLTGDLPGEKEDDLFQSGISARVLKVSHHGSKHSTTDEFLKRVSLSEAVISVGKNSYGHPSEELISRLKASNAKILRTDEMGDIVYVCAGVERKCVLQNR